MALGVVVGLALRAFAGDLSAPAPESWLAPFVLAADIFLRLLKLLIGLQRLLVWLLRLLQLLVGLLQLLFGLLQLLVRMLWLLVWL